MKSKSLDLSVDLRANPHVWPRVEGRDRKAWDFVGKGGWNKSSSWYLYFYIWYFTGAPPLKRGSWSGLGIWSGWLLEQCVFLCFNRRSPRGRLWTRCTDYISRLAWQYRGFCLVVSEEAKRHESPSLVLCVASPVAQPFEGMLSVFMWLKMLVYAPRSLYIILAAVFWRYTTDSRL